MGINEISPLARTVDFTADRASETPRAFDLPGFLVITAAGSLISLLLTGFYFGLWNNIYHLPIIAELYDEPQFAHDEFIQSLRYFASGVWFLLEGADRHFNAYWLFWSLDYVTRFLAFAGFLACADYFGFRARKERILFTAAVVLSSLVRGNSFAGGHGLFINYFTHSEVSIGLTLLTLYFLASRRIALALAVNGVVFFTNAFVAVWNAAPLAAVGLAFLLQRLIGFKRMVVESVIGIAAFALLALPVIHNVMQNPEFGAPLDYDYRDFLSQYWPFHFFLSASPMFERFQLLCVFALAAVCFARFGRTARPFQISLACYGALYVAGIFLPELTDNASLLNLHLLRVGGIFHILAALAGALLITRWLTSADRDEAKIHGPGLGLLVCSNKMGLLFAPVFVLAVAWPPMRRLMSFLVARLHLRLTVIVPLLLALIWPVMLWKKDVEYGRISAWKQEWETIARWARADTAKTAVFMVPTVKLWGVDRPYARTASPLEIWWWGVRPTDEEDAATGSTIFEYIAHRRVWVDYKRGAAVMWMPSYYHIWWPRVTAVSALKTIDDKLAYAGTNRIDYVVDLCDPAKTGNAVFKTARLCVFAASPAKN